MTAEQDQQRVEHEPSPTLTSKSPANKKVTRRSRSLVECKTPPHTHSKTITVSYCKQTQLSCNHYSTLKSNHSLQEFCLT